MRWVGHMPQASVKIAVARVWIKPGSGKVVVNGQGDEGLLRAPGAANDPAPALTVSGTEDQFDVMATVKGGGLSGQAGAVKHGISKALQLYEPSLRGALKAAGFLTRDSRVVERKKYGRRKARRRLPVLQALNALHEMHPRAVRRDGPFSCRSD